MGVPYPGTIRRVRGFFLGDGQFLRAENGVKGSICVACHITYVVRRIDEKGSLRSIGPRFIPFLILCCWFDRYGYK